MADEEKPKIIIDEDWKTQVQREKEEAQKKAGEASPDEKAAPAEAEEASFEGLVSGLAMQAMIALGVLAPRDAKEVMIDLRGAKYVIDLLMVLRDKTKGNLTPEEQGYLAESLADLQQTYVLRSQQLQEASLRQAGIDPNLKP